jgi:hypothetical protein
MDGLCSVTKEVRLGDVHPSHSAFAIGTGAFLGGDTKALKELKEA